MRRYYDSRPLDICFARGTFNAHPYVMATMNEFFHHLDTADVRSQYEALDTLWDRRARDLNERLERLQLPVRVSNLTSIWMVHYTTPSRYNWMFQYYLRAEGLALSWVGTGRLIFSLNYTGHRFCRGDKTLRRRGQENEGRRLVVARRFPHQQENPPADSQRDGHATQALRRRLASSWHNHASPASWFETHGAAVLLTIRVWNLVLTMTA